MIPKHQLSARKGATIIYLLVLMPVLIGLCSLMVDYGLATVVKSQLESAVDAAALAASNGISVSPSYARSLAIKVAADNRVNLKPLTLQDSDIEFGTWDSTAQTFTLLTGSNESTANAVRITGQLATARGNALQLYFLPLIKGSSSVQMTASAVARGVGDQIDWIMIQDLSGSFTSELPVAKSGDQDLLTSLNTPGTQGKFGLVGFTGFAKTIASLQSISTGYSALTTAVSSLSINGAGMPSTGTGTDIATGIEQAQSLFDAAPATNHTRSMIIVSDGQPNSSSKGSHPTFSDAQLLTLAQQDADTAWSKKINVFVIWWDSSNGADLTSGANLQSLVRGKGTYIHVTDPNALSSAIQSVATNRSELVK